MKNELGDEIDVLDSAPAIGAPPAAFTAATQKINALGDPIDSDDHGLKVLNGTEVSASQAAKSMDLAAKTGVPASFVHLDPAFHEQNYNVAEGVSAGNRNPYIANYINDVPMAASVSQGDWRKLEISSQSLQALSSTTSANQLLLDGLAGWGKGLLETVRGFGEGFGSESLGAGPEFLAKNPSWLIFQPVSVVLDAMLRAPNGIIHGVARNAALRYEQLGGNPGEKEGVYREVVNLLGFMMIEAGTVKPEAGAPVNRLSTKAELDAFHGVLEGLKNKAEMDAFLKEKAAEITPERLQITYAKKSSADLSKAVAEANQTETKAVSPTAYEQFAEIHGGLGTVHIPATTILELYQAEGKVPLKGDKLFGFIPNIAEKMLSGAESKTEIAVPMSQYVANIDEALHEKIRARVRVQVKGTTLEEAKELADNVQARPEGVTVEEGKNLPSYEKQEQALTPPKSESDIGEHFPFEYNIEQNDERVQHISDNISTLTNELKRQYPKLAEQLGGIEDYFKAANDNGLDIHEAIDKLGDTLVFVEKNGGSTEVTSRLSDMLEALEGLSDDMPHKASQHSGEVQALHKDYREIFNAYVNPAPGSSGASMPRSENISRLKQHLQKLTRTVEANKAEGRNGLGDKKLVTEKLATEDAIAALEKSEQAVDTLRQAAGPAKEAVVGKSPEQLKLDLELNGNKITIAAEEAPVALEFLHTVEMERKTLYLEPLFTKGKDVNITQLEFKQYSDLIDRANETILTKAVAIARSQIAQTMTHKWRTDALQVKDKVTNEIESRPVMRVDQYLRTGSLQPGQWMRRVGTMVKLDKAAVEEVLGEGGLARHTAEDGADINVLAQTFGFKTGADMVRALDALAKDRAAAGLEPREYFNRAVKEETESRMQAEHGHLSDNIAVAASELALHKFNVDLLSAEWKILSRLAGKDPPLARADLTVWAEEQFGKGYVSQASYETYRRAADKAGREAEKALLKKKYVEALNAKQTQVLNFLLAKEAKGFEKEVKKNENILGKYAGEDNLPAVDQKYTDQIHSLMLDYNMPISRTADNVAYNLGGKTLPVFIAEQKGQGASLVEPILPRPGTKIEDFTVNEYRDFASLVQNLDHVGRKNKKIEIAGKKEDYERGMDAILKNVDTFVEKGFNPDVTGVVSALRKLGRFVDSNLYKVESLIDRIDHHNPLGALNTAIHRPLIEGQAGVGFMLTKLAKMINKLPSDRAWGKNLNVLADNQELVDFHTRELLRVTNEQKVAMALNYGNKGNRDVMLRAHNFTEAEMESFLDRTMSPMDWKVVNAIHAIFELLAPLVEEVTMKKSGLAVPLVQPMPFLNSKGGYYPLVQDPKQVLIGAKNQTDLFDKTKFDPLPMASALKQRTGAVYKLDFSLSRLHSVLAQTTHAVYMQEPVINANKIIKDPLFRESIVNAFGPEYVKMLDDWISDIANNGGQNNDMILSWISRNSRENVTTMLMGYKASTATIHGVSAGFASLYEIGKMYLAEKGAKSFVLAPAELIKNMRELGLGQFLPEEARRMFSSDTKMLETMNEVMSESLELPNRVRALQKDFGYQLNKIVNKNIIDDVAQARAIYHAYSMSMVAYLDLLTATPVWKAAKTKAILDGYENADAIYIADKTVREAHGSASLVSRANVGRGEVGKWATIAYNGYWNHNYNKFREVINILREPAESAPREGPQAGMGSVGGGSETLPPRFTEGMKVALGAGFVTAMVVAGAMIHHAIRGDESETTEGAILKMMLSQFGGMVPGLNVLTYAIIHNRDPHVSGADKVLSIIKDVGVDISKLMEGKEPKHPWKHGAQAVGYLTGIGPTEQIIASMSFMNDVLNDDQSPEGIGQWLNGLMSGRAEPKRHK